jgi:hypothetical protein
MRENEREERVEVDESLIAETLRLSPRERVLQNDRLLRMVSKLEQGFAAFRARRDP